MSTITVVNKHHLKSQGPDDFYIGRGSPLGNPYPIGPGATRAEVIAKYKTWLDHHVEIQDPPILDELARIADKVIQGIPVRLVCFCKPQACHGDHIKQIICEALANT